jgi:hypothetical protein
MRSSPLALKDRGPSGFGMPSSLSVSTSKNSSSSSSSLPSCPIMILPPLGVGFKLELRVSVRVSVRISVRFRVWG